MPFKVDGNVEVRDTLSLMKDLGSGIYGEVLRFNDNVISTQVTNGDIQIAPNGSGDVYLGLLAGNSQITNASNISISSSTISTPLNDDLILSTSGTGVIRANNINITQGKIESNVTNGNLEILPNGTGTLKLGANLELDSVSSSTFNGISGNYSALSLVTANVGAGEGRHLVLDTAGTGYVIMNGLGIKGNTLQNVVGADNVEIIKASNIGATENRLVLDSSDFSVISTTPSLKLKTSDSDTILTVNNSGTDAKFDASGFSFVNGSNAFLGASSSGIAVMKSGAASEALDITGNVAASGNVVAGGNLVAGTGVSVTSGGIAVTSGGVTVTSGGVTVNSGDMTVSAGNLSVSSGNLVVSGTISDGNGVLGSTPWTTSGSNLYYTGGNIGVGTSSPSSTLDVAGNINFTGTLYQNGLAFTGDSQWTLDGSDIVYSVER